MGFKTAEFPPVDTSTFLHQPLRERIKALTLHWVEYGFGSPRMIAATYLVKIAVLWLLIGSIVITATSGVGWFWQVDQWWNQPIVYQKAIIWTMLLEAIGLAGSWGPTAGKFKPMTGGIQFWARPGTIRLRPWAWVPGTAGDTRTVFDVVVYLGFLAALATALVLPGTVTPALAAALPENTSGLVQTTPVIVAIALLVIVGVRDKTIAVASRIEQYLPALVFFSVLSFVDMIIALKLLIVAVWVCAGISKFGRHFVNVIPPMLSNTPFWPPRWLKRALYRDFPRDVRPSKLAHFMAHAMGTTVEIAVPLVLLFSQNFWVTLAAVVLIVGFHLFIFSTFPLAVPLEWNTLFCYAAVFLFLGFPAQAGYAVTDFSNGWLLAAIVAALLFFPALGNLRPDKVSFLPSMRQYAGNWASALWTFTPGAEQEAGCRHPAHVEPGRSARSAGLRPRDRRDHDAADACVALDAQPGSRTLLGALPGAARHRDPHDPRGRIRLQLGDRLQLRRRPPARRVAHPCPAEPLPLRAREFVVVWVESQAIHADFQEYKVIDAAAVSSSGEDGASRMPWRPPAVARGRPHPARALLER